MQEVNDVSDLDEIQEVVRDCAVQGVSVAPVLAHRVMQLVNLDPAFHGSSKPHRSRLRSGHKSNDRIRAACSNFLLSRKSPSLAAVRMTIAFSRKYRSREMVSVEHSSLLSSRLEPLISELLQVGEEVEVRGGAMSDPGGVGVVRGGGAGGTTRNRHERLYRNMVAAAVLRSGLGNPADPAVMKEATAAMQSVYPLREVPHFLCLPSAERREQLAELSDITAGIRIFNWDCKKNKAYFSYGAARRAAVPTLLQDAAAATERALNDSLRSVESRLWKMTAALESVILPESTSASISGITYHDTELLKDSVILLRQQQALLKTLFKDVEQSAREARMLCGQLRSCLEEIHGVVQIKTAVPTSQVYPQFVSLARTWNSLESQAVVISKAANLLRRLFDYCQNVHTVDDDVIDVLLSASGRHWPSDTEREARISVPVTAKVGDADQQLQFAGFCPWFLAVSGGGLLPGSGSLQLHAPDGRRYALSTREAAHMFASDPNRFITKAMNEVGRRPALISFLGLQDHLSLIRRGSQLDSTTSAVNLCDVFVQTDWLSGHERAVQSVRCVRRSAMEPLKGKGGWQHSVSTQTSNSAYRRSAAVQTFPSRDSAVQCPRHVGSNAPSVAPSLLSLDSAPQPLLDEVRSLPQLSIQEDADTEAGHQPIPATSFLELSISEGRSRDSSISDRTPYLGSFDEDEPHSNEKPFVRGESEESEESRTLSVLSSSSSSLVASSTPTPTRSSSKELNEKNPPASKSPPSSSS